MKKVGLTESLIHPISSLMAVTNYFRYPEVRKVVKKGGNQFSANKFGSYYDPCFCPEYNQNRTELYRAYEEIAFDPLTTSIIDNYAKSCSQNNSESGEHNGKVVWCFSSNPDVKQMVNNFLRIVDIDNNAYSIFRPMIYLGDHYENIPGVPNQGVVAMLPYDPWNVGNIIDGQYRVSGYAKANSMGDVVSGESETYPFYSFLHFKTLKKKRKHIYGAFSSLLYNVREYYQDLQWIEDKIIMERLNKRATRLGILLDTSGMSGEDAWIYCEEIKRRLYRDQFYDPTNGVLDNQPKIWGEFKDIILPTGGDNRTQITTIPETSSQGTLDDLYYYLRRYGGALKYPLSSLGLDLGDSFDRSQPIEKQDLMYAQNCQGYQKAFLTTLTLGAMIHLSYYGIDVRNPNNGFALVQVPVNAYQEMERRDLINMRYDLMDRTLNIGRDNQWNMDFWTTYVMREYAQLSDDVIMKLLEKPKELEEAITGETSDDDSSMSSEDGDSGGSSSDIDDFKFESVSNKDTLANETLANNPELKKVLQFYQSGGSMHFSKNISENINRITQVNKRALPVESQEFENGLRVKIGNKKKAKLERLRNYLGEDYA